VHQAKVGCQSKYYIGQNMWVPHESMEEKESPLFLLPLAVAPQQ